MVPWRVIKYAAIAIGLLVLVGVVLSLVAAIVSLVWTAITITATLLVLAGIGYGVVKGIGWLRNDGDSAGRVDDGATDRDPVERLTERYVDGELTEDELERRLDRILGGPDHDEIDRELKRVKERG